MILLICLMCVFIVPKTTAIEREEETFYLECGAHNQLLGFKYVEK